MNDTDYLGKLQDYYAKHRLLPSFAAISELLGMKSKGSVAALAKRLQEHGYIESGPSGRLAPGKRFFEREIVDSVRAGAPHPLAEVALGRISIDEHLIRNPSKSLLLKVKGDSMVDAGLMEDDVVVVQRGSPAKTGDIVVAIVDNEFTIKYLELDDKGEFYLRPGNKAYPHIRPKEQLEVFGKVVGSFRSYG